MLFTTVEFVALFLPITILGFFVIARRSHAYAAGWLFLASLVFYGYWMPQFVALLLGSIAWNYVAGTKIASSEVRATRRGWFIAGVSVDLALLAWFKYANFFVASVNEATGATLHIPHVVLPIGISFFTFTQIAFLADAYLKGLKEYRAVPYGLFVTYFPHLVAGPVLHHAQMMPQFARAETYRPNLANFSAGLAIFAIGLWKKVVFADGISPYADAVFDSATAGVTPATSEAWLGAIAYTNQLYFDFSGYSDMAIGLSLLFNITLPYNFDSPYKATSISDFWRRWHISLSNFLRDYLYIPLGGNRKGAARRYLNLFITMLLGGLWHGANWTFVFWGGLHGAYLAVNHGFAALVQRHAPRLQQNMIYRLVAWAMTLLAVVVAWVFFRAPTFDGAARILTAMFAFDPRSAAPEAVLLWNQGLAQGRALLLCATLTAIAVLLPNSNRIGETLLDFARRRRSWVPTLLGAALFMVVLLVLINETRNSVSAFIYFNF